MGNAIPILMAIILVFTFTLDADNNAVVAGYEGVETAIAVPTTLNDYPVAGIGNEAFFDCDSLVSVTLPDGLQTIGYGAFSECDSLVSVTLPASLQFIDEDAFYGSDHLTLTVTQGSYAHTYAVENGIPFQFAND